MKFFIAILVVAYNLWGDFDDSSPWDFEVNTIKVNTNCSLNSYKYVDSFNNIKNGHYQSFDIYSSFVFYPLELFIWKICMHIYKEKENLEFEGVSLVAENLLYDDLAGDPLSLSVGIKADVVNNKFTKKVQRIHHGSVNLQLYGKLGREKHKNANWMHRNWGMIGFESGGKGSLMMNLHICHENNLGKGCVIKFFADSCLGFGKKSLSEIEGYRGVKHRFVDGGIAVNFSGVNDFCTLEIRRRLLAKNALKKMFSISLSVSHPLSI